MDCMRDHFDDGFELDSGRFKAMRPLNHGSFGMVFMATDANTGNAVAIKCLTKRTAGMDEATSAFAVDEKSEELECHARLGAHPNIVNLVHSFETDAHVYLVLEYCSRGDLYEAIRLNRGPLETEHVREFMLQLVDAVAYIHSKGMYHRDIKPENIFLTYDGDLKLGDFGLATKETWSYETTVGSDRYMSPEQYDSDGAGYSPEQADIWAVGICLLNILFSRNPFMAPTESDPLFLDYSRDSQSLLDVFPDMSMDTFEVITHCMSLDPRKRSLSAVREALLRAVSFTNDDESFDKFCASSGSPTIASANREPLRTPSIASPQVDQAASFPWAKALHASPPQQTRQLSTINDTESYDEDLFPSSEESAKDWFSVNGTPSIGSIFNSSLGESMKSLAIRRSAKQSPPRPDLTPISGSLPVSMTKPKPIPSLASVFKKETVSKSWGDLWDEDMEELEEDQQEKDLRERQAFNSRTWSHDSKTDDFSTPRQGLSEPKGSSFVNTRNNSPERKTSQVDDIDGDMNDGFFFQDTTPERKASPPRYSPPSKRTTFDKWSALGDRRRAATTSSEKTPDVWGRGRRNTNTSNNMNNIHHYPFGNGTSANVKGGAIFPSTASSFGVWDSLAKDKVHGPSTATHKNSFFNNNLVLGDRTPRAKTKGRDTKMKCPWDWRVTSPNKDMGDLEWVGGWQDEQSELDLGLQL